MALWNIQQQEEYSVQQKNFNNKKDMKRKFKVGASLAVALKRKVERLMLDRINLH